MQEHWTVKLRDDHPDYNEIKLKRSLPDNAKYTVVIVDTTTFLDCYSRDIPGYIIPPVSEWEEGKEEGIRDFLNPSFPGIPDMPRVSISLRQRRQRRRFWQSAEIITEAAVTFVNGRHRSLYMAFSGALSFPVEIHISEADLLRQYCGLSV